jgi:type II secretory ATPase GspE/PulE/Tfp pilus assembly ATPase PilB-like protein
MSAPSVDSANTADRASGEAVFPASASLACRVVEVSHDDSTVTFLCDAESDTSSAAATAFRVGLHAVFRKTESSLLDRELERLHASAIGKQGESIKGSLLLKEDAAPYSATKHHYIESVIARAVAEKASDIHLQPEADGLAIRLRIDGRLRTVEHLPGRTAAPLIAQIKVLAKLPLAERRLPHDGRFSVNAGGTQTDLRVSIVPSIHGETAVLRIEDDVAPTSLDELNMPAPILARLRTLLKRRGGLILVGGPTGSGKTTTLYAMLRHLNDAGSKLLSVEDPVERIIPGVNQVPVETGGMGFGESIRAMLRHSPDAIMIGEIRDGETAQAACEAALTGHLVLASAHARDGVEVAIRVADLGVSRQVVSCVLEAALTQRLVRVLCPDCSRTATPPAPLARALGMEDYPPDSCREAVGCPACGGTGYRGRRAIFGCMTMNDSLRRALAAGSGALALGRLSEEAGNPTLADAARALALQGITSPEEATLSASLEDYPTSLNP